MVLTIPLSPVDDEAVVDPEDDVTDAVVEVVPPPPAPVVPEAVTALPPSQPLPRTPTAETRRIRHGDDRCIWKLLLAARSFAADASSEARESTTRAQRVRERFDRINGSNLI
jgi:hypothetical protein